MATTTPPTFRGTSRAANLPDRIFRNGTRALGWAVVGILVLIGIVLSVSGSQAFATFGPGFITGTTWDPVKDVYGALPYIVGTLAAATIAIVLAMPLGVLTAVYLAELAPRRVAIPLTFMIELLAAIPSVVFGLWGVFVLSPLLRSTVEAWFVENLGWIPIFAGPSFGVGLFAAGVILAIMILPTIVSISREVISSIPGSHREAMFALGATRWEVVTKAVLPAARSGIVGAVILGFGRALGETMAVTMVIGNAQSIPTSIFGQSQTIASKIATTFSEASVGIQTSSLIALGLILLVITLALNVIARTLVAQAAGGAVGAD